MKKKYFVPSLVTFVLTMFFGLLPIRALAATATATTAANSDAAAIAMFVGLFSIVIPCLISLLSLAATAFWIWMLVDIIKRDDCNFSDSTGKDLKIVWLLVVIFTQSLGAVIYYFMVYAPRKNKIVK
jgi:hypothetical protein